MIAYRLVARDGVRSAHSPPRVRRGLQVSRTPQRQERRNRARHAILRKLDMMPAAAPS